jgi:DnaK suppressor protein
MTHTISAMQHHHAMVHLERLENMLADLLRLISEQRGGERTRAEVAAESLPGPGDSHAQSMTQRDMDFCLGEREIDRMHEIGAALKRLHQGSDGFCTECGMEILEGRLDAMPETPHCLTCQTQLEAHGAAR